MSLSQVTQLLKFGIFLYFKLYDIYLEESELASCSSQPKGAALWMLNTEFARVFAE